MNTIYLSVLLAVPLALSASEVKPGDSIADLQAAMGVARGQMVLGERALFYYDRGEIEAHGGVVTRVAVRSIAEQAAFENRRAVEAARVRDEQAIRDAQLTLEGNALKARKMADLAFLAAPLDYQVAFWEDFSRHYAGVPCAENLSVARARLAANLADAQARADQAQRIVDLEYRVAAAEAHARESRSNDYFPAGYGSYYSGSGDYYSRCGYGRNQSTSLSYSYRLYQYPMPYATSPGMPLMQPTYRAETLPVSGSQWGDSMGNGADGFPNSGGERSRMSRGASSARRF